jgi:hypothetical protein
MKTTLIITVMLALLSGLALAQEGQQGYSRTWQYQQEEDAMGRGTKYYASLFSLNEIELGFPYQGSQPACLVVRNTPRYGNEVMLIIARGQFASTYTSDYVTVRFDGGPLEKFAITAAANGQSNRVFINEYGRFVNQVLRSSRVLIEATFFRDGARVVEFDVRGLNVASR